MKRLKIEPIEAEAFRTAPSAPAAGRRPSGAHGRIAQRSRWRATAPVVRDRRAQALPLTAVQMERHVHSSQAFAPLDCASYLVLVAPHGAGGMPDLEKVRAFRVPGDMGINYKADTWHHPLTPLERIGRFAVFTFVDGTADDEQFVDLPQSVLIEG
jgi:ureidoglycolate lyase